MAEELFSLYHGGMQEDANLSTIDPYKVAIKQNRRGKPTQSVGFYMSSDPAVANYYAQQNNGAIHQMNFPANVKIADYGSGIERVSPETLKQYATDGFQLIKGQNTIGNTEYILVDPQSINSARLVNPNEFENETSGAMGRMLKGSQSKGVPVLSTNGAAPPSENLQKLYNKQAAFNTPAPRRPFSKLLSVNPLMIPAALNTVNDIADYMMEGKPMADTSNTYNDYQNRGDIISDTDFENEYTNNYRFRGDMMRFTDPFDMNKYMLEAQYPGMT